MSVSIQKSALRKHLLEKRDATSAELRDIVSEKIHENLKKISSYTNSQNIACYFPIGSEVDTRDIMLNILEQGKNLLLPKIVNDNIEFYIVPNLETLENVGLVIHSHLGHGGATYHAADDINHLHLVCGKCGSVGEAPIETAAQFVNTIAYDYSFKTDVTHFAIHGTCARCLETL